MGFIGGAINSVSEAAGGLMGGNVNGFTDDISRTNKFQANMPAGMQNQEFLAAIQASQADYNQNIADQRVLAQALQAQSRGEGPNPALEQLRMTTDQNIQQSAGLMAAQRGLNPALAARLGSQTAANMNQTAGGQAAVLGAQQQLGAQNALGNLYGNIGNQSLQQHNILQGGVLGQNRNISDTSLGVQRLNAGVEAQNSGQQAQVTGGLLNAAGGAAGIPMSGGMASGGKMAAPMFSGGRVPGQAQVAGDHPANDSFAAALSPGEVVIPRTAAQNPDSAKAFIDHIMSDSEPEDEGYGAVLKSQKALADQMKRLEAMMKKKGK